MVQSPSFCLSSCPCAIHHQTPRLIDAKTKWMIKLFMTIVKLYLPLTNPFFEQNIEGMLSTGCVSWFEAADGKSSPVCRNSY